MINGEDKLLTAQNKWLIAHEEAQIPGAFCGLVGEKLLAKHFEGPKMFFAAAEERGDNLLDGRGDAYCGMLNASYNLKLYQSQELSLD